MILLDQFHCIRMLHRKKQAIWIKMLKLRKKRMQLLESRMILEIILRIQLTQMIRCFSKKKISKKTGILLRLLSLLGFISRKMKN